MSLETRLRRVADAAECGRCGLRLVEIRAHLLPTRELLRREVAPERAEAVENELKRIWTS